MENASWLKSQLLNQSLCQNQSPNQSRSQSILNTLNIRRIRTGVLLVKLISLTRIPSR